MTSRALALHSSPVTRYDRLVADLQPGEELLWCEEPAPFAYILQNTNWLPSLLITAFLAMVYFATAADRSDDVFWALFALLIWSWFFHDVFRGLRTLYAITTKRLIVLHPSPFSIALDSYYPPDIDFVKKQKNRRGSGSLVFATIREQGGKRTRTVKIGFFGIDDVDSVEARLLALRPAPALRA